MSKTQDRVTAAKAQVDQLAEAKAQWDKLAKQDPGSQNKAHQAAVLGDKLEKAKEALDRAAAAAALAAKPDSPEAKRDLARLDKINKEGLALTDDITERLEALHGDMIRWQELQDEARRLAATYERRSFTLGIAGSRLDTVRLAVTRWIQEVRAWERHKEITAQGAVKPANPDKLIFPSKREKMLKERYPER